MIGAVLGEARKFARRPAVWLCLAIVVALLVALGYGIVWWVYSHPPPNFQQQLPRGLRVSDLKRALYPAHYHQQLLGFTVQLGSAIALVLGVLSVGSEYGWNTLKTLLTQRPGRLQVMAAKYLILVVLMLVFTLVMAAGAALASLGIAAVDGADISFPAPQTTGQAILADWLIMTVWALFGAFLAFAFRQSALAIGLGLVYVLIVEGLIFSLAGTAGGETFRRIQQWFPAANANALYQSFGSAVPSAVTTKPVAGGTHAVAVLLAYAAAFVIASAIFLRARDVS